MTDLIPLRGLLPPVLPRAVEQSFDHWRLEFPIEYQSVRAHEVPKWVRDHFASVSEFLAWKAGHPRDGTLTVLYRWTPVMVAAISTLSINPVGFGVIPALFGRRPGRRRAEG